jgi:hypothetical protein
MHFWHLIVPPLFSLLVLSDVGGVVQGADKIAATILVKDALTAPRQEATIEAEVLSKGLLRQAPLGGEPVELVVKGSTAATGMTGADGRARLSVVPSGKSIVPVKVKIGASSRVSPAEGQANLVVWERRTPILVVELFALTEEGSANGPFSGIGAGLPQDVKPLPDAADELAKLSRFYYGIMYVVSAPSGADGFAISTETRNWLAAHTFPAGLVVALSSGEDALGAKIDALHDAGWKSLRTGIGRSKPFVETFLRRRLEAIVVPQPSKGDAPRKAKVAKDWKEVRKKL